MRPWEEYSDRYRVVYEWSNIPAGAVLDEGSCIVSIECIYDEGGGECIADGVYKGRQLLYVANALGTRHVRSLIIVKESCLGMISVYDVSALITEGLAMNAVKFEDLPKHSKSFNPRRRVRRDMSLLLPTGAWDLNE